MSHGSVEYGKKQMHRKKRSSHGTSHVRRNIHPQGRGGRLRSIVVGILLFSSLIAIVSTVIPETPVTAIEEYPCTGTYTIIRYSTFAPMRVCVVPGQGTWWRTITILHIIISTYTPLVPYSLFRTFTQVTSVLGTTVTTYTTTETVVIPVQVTKKEVAPVMTTCPYVPVGGTTQAGCTTIYKTVTSVGYYYYSSTVQGAVTSSYSTYVPITEFSTSTWLTPSTMTALTRTTSTVTSTTYCGDCYVSAWNEWYQAYVYFFGLLAAFMAVLPKAGPFAPLIESAIRTFRKIIGDLLKVIPKP